MRMVVLSQVDRFGEMRGIITTLHKQGAMLQPVAAPIVFARREAFSGAFGEVAPGSPSHAEYKKTLDETTTQGYARLVGK
jgi:hypothetical protein